jgi:hypothetical protein
MHRTTIAELDRSPKLMSPTLLLVGEVVRHSDPTLQETILPAAEAEFALSPAFLADYPSRTITAGDEEPLA